MRDGQWGCSEWKGEILYGEGPVPGCGKKHLRIHRVFKDVRKNTQAPEMVQARIANQRRVPIVQVHITPPDNTWVWQRSRYIRNYRRKPSPGADPGTA